MQPVRSLAPAAARPRTTFRPPSDRVHAGLLGVVATLFVAAVGLGLHGLSLPAWHQTLDGSAPSEVVFGTTRAIRSDDWLVGMSLALAQRAALPAYPAVNPAIGDGQPMALFEASPVAGVLTIFRPWTWGFYAGADAGLAWAWSFRLLGVLYASFLVFRRLSRGNSAVALALALALTFSPTLQYWSLCGADLVVAAMLSMLGLAAMLDGGSHRSRWLGGALAGWAAGMAANTMYPAFAVTAAMAVVATAAALVCQRQANLEPAEKPAWRGVLGPAALAGVVFAAGAWALYLQVAPSLGAIAATTYPGQRVEMGGDLSLSVLLGGNLLNARGTRFWGILANVCEEATFFWTFPAVFAGLAVSAWSKRRRPSAAEWCLTGTIVFLLVFAFIGLPSLLSRATGLSQVPASRIRFGLGLCDLLLLAVFAGEERAYPRPALAAPLWAAAATAGLYLGAWPALAAGVPSFVPGIAAALVLVLGGVAFLLVRSPGRGAAGLAALSVASTLWFNPLVRGGSDFLLGNPLSVFIRAESKRVATVSGKPAVWAAFGSVYTGHLFRVLGVRSVSGVVFPPPTKLWELLAPIGTEVGVYNRYANIVFEATPGAGWLESDQADRVVAHLRPDGPELRRAGVTDVLVEGAGAAEFSRSRCFQSLYTNGKQTVYGRTASDCGG